MHRQLRLTSPVLIPFVSFGLDTSNLGKDHPPCASDPLILGKLDLRIYNPSTEGEIWPWPFRFFVYEDSISKP
jgi:hypothetical protein